MERILFIGSHLSRQKGTKSASETTVKLLQENFIMKLSSKRTNLFLRFIDIIGNVLFWNYNIIHIDVYSGKALIYAKISLKIAKFRKKKVIMNLHGGRLVEVYKKNPKTLLFIKKSDRIISPSLFLTQFFNKNSFLVSTIPNFINSTNFPYQRKNYQKNSLLWIRAFDSIYQPLLAIRIVDKLKKKYPNIHLTMIGPDKGLQKKVEQYIKKLNLTNYISIKGKIENNKLYKYYHSHHIYLNTTKFESFGLSVLEAASSGIPIVSNNIGEIPYIWKDNEEILLSNNEEEFITNIMKIFSSTQLEKKLSENAKKKAMTFSEKTIKEKWIKVINETI
jgi:glycosyltransferase involved in cell wall biosynthesis